MMTINASIVLIDAGNNKNLIVGIEINNQVKNYYYIFYDDDIYTWKEISCE